MANTRGFFCSRCGKHHDGLPFSYGALAPAHWREDLTSDPNSLLTDEQCVIDGQHFFVRARIVLPVVDAAEDFEWGVWMSLSQPNYSRACQMWTAPERVDEPPYFGWLSTELLYEPTTLNLKTNLHMQPVGSGQPSSWSPPTTRWQWSNARASPWPASRPSRNISCIPNSPPQADTR